MEIVTVVFHSSLPGFILLRRDDIIAVKVTIFLASWHARSIFHKNIIRPARAQT